MYIVTWKENGSFKTMAFNDFSAADNYAASRSYHWGFAALEGANLYRTYKDGKEMAW